MKLKNLKEQPLLNPPTMEGGRGWWEVTGKDKRMMERYQRTVSPEHPSFPEICYHLGELGVPYKITADDIRRMDVGLMKAREDEKGDDVLRTLLYMKKVGYPRDVTAGDLELMKKELEKSRKETYGVGLAWSHYMMKELGCPQEITPEDREKMMWTLDFLRQLNMLGWLVSGYHYVMGELGLPHELTQKEVDYMREELDKERRKPRPIVYQIMIMLLHLRRIMPEPEEEAGGKMPPIKDIGK